MADDSNGQDHLKGDKKSKETILQTAGQIANDLQVRVQNLDTSPSNLLSRVVIAIILIQFVMVLFADLDEGFFVLCLLLYGFVFLLTKGTRSVALFFMWCIFTVMLLNVLASIADVWGAPF